MIKGLMISNIYVLALIKKILKGGDVLRIGIQIPQNNPGSFRLCTQFIDDDLKEILSSLRCLLTNVAISPAI
eukprot:6067158-Karenia_brevis.AAC.1